MSGVATAIGGSALLGVGGSLISANANENAAKTQAQAAQDAAQLQYQEYEQQQQNEQPWLQAGRGALSQMGSMTANAPSFTQQDFLANQDPGYQFNLQQGMSALQNSAAARGGLMSGNTLQGISNYSQGMASNEYGNAYNRFMNNQNTQFNRLSSIAGMGQTATTQLGNEGMNYANNAGNDMMGAANAIGGAQVANGQMWGNSLSGIGRGAANNWMTMSMLNRMYPQQPPGGGGLAPAGTGGGGNAGGGGYSLGADIPSFN